MGNPNQYSRLGARSLRRFVAVLAVMSVGHIPAAFAQENTGATTPSQEVSDPVVAIVGTEIIRESDVQNAMQALTLGDQIDVRSRRARFIDSLVREELLFQFALERMRRDPAARARVKSVVVGDLIEHDVRSQATVSEEEARTYFEATKPNLGGEHITLRDIQFADAQVCKTQFERIATLDDFTKVARAHHAIPDLAETGGEVGTVMTRHVAFGYGDKLKGLKENTAHLLHHEGRCHIVWLADRQILPVPTFDELRERLIAGLKAGAEAERLNVLIGRAEARVGVTRLTKTEAQDNEVASHTGQSATTAQAAATAPTQSTEPQPTPAARPEPGTWKLTSHNGEAVTNASLEGRPSVMAFGFTHCPDICPATLVEMTNWIDSLGAKAKTASWSFVSVDPERDTTDVLKDYVSNFSDNIVALTGGPAQLASLVKKYDIVVRRVATENNDYTMDHSASVLLLGKDGKLVDSIRYGTDVETAVAQLNRLLDAQ